MRTLASVGLVTASLLALAAIIPWGDLQSHSHWTRVAWVPFVWRPLRVRDIAANLLLCAPIGVFAAGALRRPLWGAFLITVAISVAGEWAQVYSHERFPSMTDVVCNVAGAIAGAHIARRVGRRRARQ